MEKYKFNGSRLVALRDSKNISINKAAETVGVSMTLWKKWEMESHAPSVRMLIKIHEAFDVPPAYFFTEIEL